MSHGDDDRTLTLNTRVRFVFVMEGHNEDMVSNTSHKTHLWVPQNYTFCIIKSIFLPLQKESQLFLYNSNSQLSINICHL